MRPLLLLLAILVPPLFAQTKPVPEPKSPSTQPNAPAPSVAPPKNIDADPKGLQGQFSFSLISNYSEEYRTVLVEALKSFQARDFKTAIKYVEKADAIQPPTSWTHNIRGAVAIEARNFDEGVKQCTAALRLDPEFFPAKFNLIEIPFLQERYTDARKDLMALYGKMGADPALKDDNATSELLVYRIYLTHLFEKDFVNAKVWMEKIPFPSRTPSYQYAQAAWERQHGDLEKWKDWIHRAEDIWPHNRRTSFMDVLIQRGWLKEDGTLGDQ